MSEKCACHIVFPDGTKVAIKDSTARQLIEDLRKDLNALAGTDTDFTAEIENMKKDISDNASDIESVDSNKLDKLIPDGRKQAYINNGTTDTFMLIGKEEARGSTLVQRDSEGGVICNTGTNILHAVNLGTLNSRMKNVDNAITANTNSIKTIQETANTASQVASQASASASASAQSANEASERAEQAREEADASATLASQALETSALLAVRVETLEKASGTGENGEVDLSGVYEQIDTINENIDDLYKENQDVIKPSITACNTIATQAKEIAQNVGSIANQARETANSAESIALSHEEVLTQNTTDIATIKEDINTINSDIKSLKTNDILLRNYIDSNTEEISLLKEKDENIESRLDSLEPRVKALEDSKGSVTQEIFEEFVQEIIINRNSIADHEKRITNLESLDGNPFEPYYNDLVACLYNSDGYGTGIVNDSKVSPSIPSDNEGNTYETIFEFVIPERRNPIAFTLVNLICTDSNGTSRTAEVASSKFYERATDGATVLKVVVHDHIGVLTINLQGTYTFTLKMI